MSETDMAGPCVCRVLWRVRVVARLSLLVGWRRVIADGGLAEAKGAGETRRSDLTGSSRCAMYARGAGRVAGNNEGDGDVGGWRKREKKKKKRQRVTRVSWRRGERALSGRRWADLVLSLAVRAGGWVVAELSCGLTVKKGPGCVEENARKKIRRRS
jgi:hypothetical protein